MAKFTNEQETEIVGYYRKNNPSLTSLIKYIKEKYDITMSKSGVKYLLDKFKNQEEKLHGHPPPENSGNGRLVNDIAYNPEMGGATFSADTLSLIKKSEEVYSRYMETRDKVNENKSANIFYVIFASIQETLAKFAIKHFHDTIYIHEAVGGLYTAYLSLAHKNMKKLTLIEDELEKLEKSGATKKVILSTEKKRNYYQKQITNFFYKIQPQRVESDTIIKRVSDGLKSLNFTEEIGEIGQKIIEQFDIIQAGIEIENAEIDFEKFSRKSS